MASEAQANGRSKDQVSTGESRERKRYHLRASSRNVRRKIAELSAFDDEGWCEDCFRAKSKHRKYAHLRTVRECATARERGRMHALNDAFEKLRRVIPKTVCSGEQKLSKIATLRQATCYISMLANILNCDQRNEDCGDQRVESDAMDPQQSREETTPDSSAENSSGTDYESQSSPDELLFTEG